jgi:hypothetical protein
MIQLSGRIIKYFPQETRGTAQKPFDKIVFWLEEVTDNETFKNIWQLELWQDDCKMAKHYQVGEYVTCYIDIKGRRWQKDDREGVMNSLKCWNFEREGRSYKEIKI